MAETFYLSLVQSAVFPQAVYLFLRLLGKIVGHDLPQFGNIIGDLTNDIMSSSSNCA